MDSDLTLSLRTVKKISETILEHIIDDLKIENIKIHGGKDFYWEALSNDLYDSKK